MVDSSPTVTADGPLREPTGHSGFRSFLEVADDRVVPATLSKATLVDLSNTLESLVLQDALPGIVLAGFQHARHWAPAEERYERLAGIDGLQVMVFAAGPLRAASDGAATASDGPAAASDGAAGVARFPLADDDPLCREWFVLALTERFSAALFARDLSGLDDPVAEMDRQFATVWTFDPTVVQDLAATLAEATATTHPTASRAVIEGAASYPPRGVPWRIAQQFTNVMFERLEADRRRLRRARADLMESQRESRSRRLLQLERLRAVGAAAVSVADGLDDPLAAITRAVGQLRAEDDADERFHLADLIEIEVVRAGRIVDDLRAFAADRDLDLRPTDLASWLGQLVIALRQDGRDVVLAGPGTSEDGEAAEVTEVADAAAVATAGGGLLAVDRHRLERAIGNLVDNAVEAPGRRQPVRIRLTIDAEEVRIVVADDGRGVADEVQPRLFEPFVSSKPNGAGTGLAIARAHVQDHGGRLELESTGPEGTSFTLHLPVAAGSRSGEMASGANGDRTDASGEASSNGAPPAPSRRRALVVNHDASTRGLLEVLLRRDGWEVVATGDTDVAAEAARTGTIDFVLLGEVLADRGGAGRTVGPAVLSALEAVQPGLATRTAFLTSDPPESGEIDGHPVLAEPFAWAELSALLGRLHPRSG